VRIIGEGLHHDRFRQGRRPAGRIVRRREVSLMSGNGVLAALREKADAHPFDR
jgi:hypothetical protein